MPTMKTKIKEYRAKFDMKQDTLAELVDVRRETIIRIEKCKKSCNSFIYCVNSCFNCMFK